MNNICVQCGKEFQQTSSGTSTVCDICKNKITTYKFGWICPKCGSVYAPMVMECFRCATPPIVTCSTTFTE